MREDSGQRQKPVLGLPSFGKSSGLAVSQGRPAASTFAALLLRAMLPPHLLSLPTTGSAQSGRLAVAEQANLPFPVKRAYWVFDVPADQVRGRHAHRTLEQLLVAVHGQVHVTVEAPGFARHTFHLAHPAQALYLPPGAWRELHFEPGAVLLCLASHEYDEADYDYEWTVDSD